HLPRSHLDKDLGARSNASKLFRHIVLRLLAVVLFSVIDPLGLSSSLSETSRLLVYRAMAVLVPDTVRDKVTLVVIDDQSANALNGERGYPVTFSQHAAVLRPILCARPAALLIDISFRNMRSDASGKSTGQIDSELQELINVLGQTHSDEQERCRRLGFPP